jgi:hypothetical protein
MVGLCNSMRDMIGERSAAAAHGILPRLGGIARYWITGGLASKSNFLRVHKELCLIHASNEFDFLLTACLECAFNAVGQCVELTLNMSSEDIQARIGPALVEYSGSGTFPDDETVAAAHINDAALPEALNLLNKAKTELEVYIFCTFHNSKPVYIRTLC